VLAADGIPLWERNKLQKASDIWRNFTPERALKPEHPDLLGHQPLSAAATGASAPWYCILTANSGCSGLIACVCKAMW